MLSLDAAQMLVLCALTVYHFYYKERVNDEVDVNTITIDDYAVEVRGLLPRTPRRRAFERTLKATLRSRARGDLGRT